MLQLFEQIEQASGSNNKKKLLATSNEAQATLLSACYDPYRQYHIRDWSQPPPLENGTDIDSMFPVFLILLKTLEELNRSSDLVTNVVSFMAACTAEQQKWFSRVIKKDMRFGANVKSINTALGGIIPTFNVMLANRFGNGTISEFPVDKTWMIQPKLDGFRAVLFADDGKFVGRSGKPLPNIHLADKVTPYLGEGLVLDGELYSHKISFQALSSILRSENKPIPDHVKFVVWDIVPLEIWKQKQETKKYADRFIELYSFLSAINENERCPFIELISDTWGLIRGDTYNYTVGKPAKYDIRPQNINDLYAMYLEFGYEGAMAKDPEAPYEWKRSKTALYKIKPEETCDAQVFGNYEGTGKYAGMLGGLAVLTEDDIEVQVGGGFSDAERKEFWENPLPDSTWIEIKYTEKSYAQNSKYPTGLRHPRFIRVRDSK